MNAITEACPVIRPGPAPAPGMVWVPAGTYRMGSDNHYPEEAPSHPVSVDGFWMDASPVTNAQFRRFVEETGYVTFCEIAPDASQYPGANPAMLVPASVVFVQPPGPVDLRNHHQWWRFLAGADWRHPQGPGQFAGRARQPPRGARRLRRCRGVCTVGRQAASDRSGVRMGRARRPRRHLPLGRRTRARRPAPGQHLAGRFPVAEPRGRRPRRHLARGRLPAPTPTGCRT